MTIIYRTTGEWGAGKGSALTAPEIDGNFFDLASRILALENDPLAPVAIESIEVIGSQFTVTLTDATVEGPFDMPLALFNWRGEWEPLTAYAEFDVFYVDSVGVYVVLQAHTSATEFNELEANTEGFYYHLLFADSSVYDLVYYRPGAIGFNDGTPLYQTVIARNLLLPETSTEQSAGQAYLAIPVTTETEGFAAVIRKNGVEIGSVTIPNGESVGTVTITANTVFAPGDILSIDHPTPEDDGADFSITLSAIRGA